MRFSFVFRSIIRNFAAENEDMVMPSVFHRGITGNQVQVLSSTRYCHLHYGKSNNATEPIGKAGFSERARKPAMSESRAKVYLSYAERGKVRP